MKLKPEINILIVEESKVFSSLVLDIAQELSLTTFLCKTGSEALALAEQKNIHLICVNYYLSDMTAEEFCTKMRQLAQAKNTRILLITSEESPELLRRALLSGATDIFEKKSLTLLENYLHNYTEAVNKCYVGRILLIEDSISQRLLLTQLLADKGFEVDAFDNAIDALKCFSREHYDLVITDIVLETTSGIDVVRAIRRSESVDKNNTPIFAISAYDDPARRMELYHLGANDYMAKPLLQEEFLHRVIILIENFRLMQQLEQEKHNLTKLALVDATTELYNRTAFNQLAPQLVSTAERKQEAIAIVVMDIDFFKAVNDTHGHDVGDLVLKDVGLWLRSVLRKGDMIFRWGGEEFMMLLDTCTAELAFKLVNNLRVRFIQRRMGGLDITASFGVSSIESYPNNKSLESCFKEADKAMYHAKENGRNRVEIFTEKL